VRERKVTVIEVVLDPEETTTDNGVLSSFPSREGERKRK
jgi:hypothetical protein